MKGIIASWSKKEVVIKSFLFWFWDDDFVFVLTGLLLLSFCLLVGCCCTDCESIVASCLSNICENWVAVIHNAVLFSSSSSESTVQWSEKMKKKMFFLKNLVKYDFLTHSFSSTPKISNVIVLYDLINNSFKEDTFHRPYVFLICHDAHGQRLITPFDV